MKPAPVPLALNYGQARASVGAGGSLVNMHLRPAPLGAKAEALLVGVPGRRPFAQLQYLNDEPALANETNVNAMIFAFGKIVVAADHAFYFVAEDGSWTRAGAGLTGAVSMAFNRTDVAAVNGTDGCWLNEGEVVSIEDADADFAPSSTVAFLDGYMIFSLAGSGTALSTGLYSRTINATHIKEAEASPDPLVALVKAGDNIFAFGSETTEVWYNAARPQFPLERVPGAVMEHGCASAMTARQYDGTAFWLTPGGRVMMAPGLVPNPISDGPVEEALKARKADWPTARAYVFADEGGVFYRLTVGGLTLAYDLAMGEWHEVRNYSRGHDLARAYVQAWGRHFVADDRGRILEMTTDALDDAGEPLIAEILSMPYHNGRLHSSVGSFEVEVDTGLSALGEEYVWLLSHSRDGGRTWGVERPGSIGRTGHYRQRVEWRKLGGGRDHRFRLRASDPFRRTMLATAHVRVG